MAGLPVLPLGGGGTRSASCSSALNSRFPDASFRGLDGSFQEWCCGSDGRSWRFWAVGWSVMMRRSLLLRSFMLARGRVRTRGSAAWMPPGRVARFSTSFFQARRTRRPWRASCHRPPLRRLTQLERRSCTFRQPWRRRRAARWPRERGKALKGRTPPARADRRRAEFQGPPPPHVSVLAHVAPPSS